MTSRSPFKNFCRSTTGKKLYYNEPKAYAMPSSQVNDLTQTAKVRQKILYRAENGMPLHKAVHNNDFVPPSCPGAKDEISSKNFGLFDDEYDLKREHEFYTHQM